MTKSFSLVLLYISTVIAAVTLTTIFIGPNITGIGTICAPLICATPIAHFVFSAKWFNEKVTGRNRYIFPALIFPVLFGILFGVNIYQSNPKTLFRRVLIDPIPASVTNIKSYDNSGGSDVEYGLAFNSNPEVIDKTIAKLHLKPEADVLAQSDMPTDPPLKYFPEIDKNQEWDLYVRFDKEHGNWWFLWANADKSTAIYRYIGG